MGPSLGAKLGFAVGNKLGAKDGIKDGTCVSVSGIESDSHQLPAGEKKQMINEKRAPIFFCSAQMQGKVERGRKHKSVRIDRWCRSSNFR